VYCTSQYCTVLEWTKSILISTLLYPAASHYSFPLSPLSPLSPAPGEDSHPPNNPLKIGQNTSKEEKPEHREVLTKTPTSKPNPNEQNIDSEKTPPGANPDFQSLEKHRYAYNIIM